MKPELSPIDHVWPVLPLPSRSVAGASQAKQSTRSTERAHGEPRRGAALTTVRLVRHCPSDAASTFAAWVEPAVAGQWLFATAGRPMVCARVDARIGGCYCLTEQRGTRIIEHRGEYIDVVPTRRLAFTLSTPDLDGETLIAVDFEPRPRGCTLTVTHTSVRTGDVGRARQRWLGMLYGLVEMLDLVEVRPHRNDCND